MGERCLAVEPLLSAWLDGELDGPESSRVEAHVAGCGNCAAAAGDLSQVSSLLANLPVRRSPAPLSPVPAHLPGEPRPPAERRVQALAVATGLLVAAVFALGSEEATERDVPAPLDAFVADQFGQSLRGHTSLFIRGWPGTEFVVDPGP